MRLHTKKKTNFILVLFTLTFYYLVNYLQQYMNMQESCADFNMHKLSLFSLASTNALKSTLPIKEDESMEEYLFCLNRYLIWNLPGIKQQHNYLQELLLVMCYFHNSMSIICSFQKYNDD